VGWLLEGEKGGRVGPSISLLVECVLGKYVGIGWTRMYGELIVSI
jgi:hypothetical protein